MSIISKFRMIFEKETKVKLIILLGAIIIGSMLETVALSIVSPFISILMDSSMLQSNTVANWIFNLLKFKKVSSFLAFLSVSLAIVYVFRGIYMYLLNKIQYRFIGRRRVELSDKLLRKTLSKSYLYHAKRNIAEFQRLILADVDQLFGLINYILLFCADVFMSTFIVLYLIIVSPGMTLCVLAMSLLSTVLYFKLFRAQAKEAGDQTREKNISMTKAVNQALGGIKEVKVLNREEFFQKQFKKESDDYIIAYQRYQVLNAVPKLFIESLCFGIAFIAIGILLASGTDIQSVIPQLSVFVLAAFRLLPAVSRLINYITGIIYFRPSVDAVYTSLSELDEHLEANRGDDCKIDTANKDITVKNVSFQYPGVVEAVLDNVSLVIPENKSVAFIGPSGAGKTTLADIILGILQPQKGSVFYNGVSIHGSFEIWSKNVGYIPQQIYLLDESILDNIAFGIDKDEVDLKKVWSALEQAQLDSFVRSLPNQLMTVVGDRGVRLSGGQRQRIGIARAIYNDPPILVLDEATSALDTETEVAVMEAVRGFQGKKTLIIIAHRLSTIEHCDLVYRVEDKNVFIESSRN